MPTLRATSIVFGGRPLNRAVVVMDPSGAQTFASTVYEYHGAGAPESRLPKRGIEANLEIRCEVEDGSLSLVKKASFSDLDEAGRMQFFANLEGYTPVV